MSNDPKTYESITTPGLKITFGQLVVELVCLNMDPKLPARFWRDASYWRQKFSREMCGFNKFSKLYADIDNPLRQKAIIAAIRQLHNQSLLPAKTLDRLDKLVAIEFDKLQEALFAMQRHAPEPTQFTQDEFLRRNAHLVPERSGGIPEKIAALEQYGKKAAC